MHEDSTNSTDVSPCEYFIAHPRRKPRLMLDELYNIGGGNHSSIYGLGPRRRNATPLRTEILEYILQQLIDEYRATSTEQPTDDDFDIF